MSDVRVLVFRNRQKVIGIDIRMVRRVALAILRDHLHLKQFEVGCHLVQAREMERINKAYLQHEGSTDVITFDHSVPLTLGEVKSDDENRSRVLDENRSIRIHGEIFICVDDAMSQATRFDTSWQTELVRYFIHGVLHLLGYDDVEHMSRRKMKRKENNLVRAVQQTFSLRTLAEGRRGSAAR